MTPWNMLVLSLATSSTQTISPSPTVMSLNTWGGTQRRRGDKGQLPTSQTTGGLPGHHPSLARGRQEDCSEAPIRQGTQMSRCSPRAAAPPLWHRDQHRGGLTMAGGSRAGVWQGEVHDSDSGTGRGCTTRWPPGGR